MCILDLNIKENNISKCCENGGKIKSLFSFQNIYNKNGSYDRRKVNVDSDGWLIIDEKSKKYIKRYL